ncbi:RDD family protein [Allonocardiopsis opalescens]|uniref:Putative RDD family membrane protein YckC n=1 Tax=Allonocardiopsis opalescens TaxID=1144618 RepID=A0A2T0QDD3_9ACTN|nr:RDD family protein [Allonocardiopsis opalescens]PRY01880.1 putative RDD family membrane protein YckC [Allonocardiopsis opalescens]
MNPGVPHHGAPPGGYGPPPGAPYGPHPYAMPRPAVSPQGVPLAESWRRLAARVIDGLVVGVPVTAVLLGAFAWMVYGIVGLSEADPSTVGGAEVLSVFGGMFLLIIAAIALPLGALWVYDWVCHARSGQTVGKRILDIKVVRIADGGLPTGGQACGRGAAYVAMSQLPVIGLLDALWLLWDEPFRQCLHDKAAGTVVVSTDYEGYPGY